MVVDRDLEALIARAAPASCVAVDMPIGLPAVEREADKLARKYVGPRRSSVFLTPPRSVLAPSTYEEANIVAASISGGKKISQQAWALRQKIGEVEKLAAADPRVIEVHPEVSFRKMRNGELEYSKNSWNGQALRRQLLVGQGIVLPDHLTEAGDVPVADVLDAGAAAWSARRLASGQAASFPRDARRDQRQVIWY